MKPLHRLLSVLVILLSIAIAALAIVVLLNPSLVSLLPWAGLLAGLVALLQAWNLENVATLVRKVLGVSGGLTTLAMGLVLVLGR